MKLSQSIQAFAILTGTIIGVGLFSLPYVASRAGMWMMLLYFILLGSLVVLIGWIYGEVVLRTKGIHRLPGYAKKYLGRWGEMTAFLASGLGLVGSILAYLIIGGGFLFSFFSPIFGGGKNLYVLVFFLFGAVLMFLGLKSIAQTEFVSLIIFLLIFILFFFEAWPILDAGNFKIDMDGFSSLFLPYGPVLYSLLGITIIPELRDILVRKPGKMKKIIFASTFVSAFIYLLFVIAVLGISGKNVSEDAITGLGGMLNGKMVKFMLLFGVLTTFTSFLTMGMTLKKMLRYDLNIPEKVSWLIASFAPLALYFFGFDSFISVISITGGVLSGVCIVLIVAIFYRAKKSGDVTPVYSLNIPVSVLYLIVLFFLIGVVLEITHVFV